MKITDAAMHEQPRGFSGFNVSPAAFLIDGIQNHRTPPDWWLAHEKKQEREQWEHRKATSSLTEEASRAEYDEARTLAFQKFCRSEEGSAIYQKTFPIVLTFHKHTDPHSAHQATLARMEQHRFRFP